MAKKDYNIPVAAVLFGIGNKASCYRLVNCDMQDLYVRTSIFEEFTEYDENGRVLHKIDSYGLEHFRENGKLYYKYNKGFYSWVKGGYYGYRYGYRNEV